MPRTTSHTVRQASSGDASSVLAQREVQTSAAHATWYDQALREPNAGKNLNSPTGLSAGHTQPVCPTPSSPGKLSHCRLPVHTTQHALSPGPSIMAPIAARLERVPSACKAVAGLSATKPVTLHRDFYPEQRRVSGSRPYLLDLCSLGDPALGIGNFAAHLRENALRVFGDAEVLAGLERAFIGRYCQLAGTPEGAVAPTH